MSSIAPVISIGILFLGSYFFLVTWALLYDSSPMSVIRDKEQKDRIRILGYKYLAAMIITYTIYFSTFDYLHSIQ